MSDINNLKLISFFSGIGAFEKALTNLDIPHEVVAFSEIDKYAIKNYCSIHNIDPSLNIGDISRADLTALPPFDLLTYGFPCQDLSIAGDMAGLKGKRSSLLKYALETIELHRPAYAIAENVKNLTGKRFREEFENLLKKLDDLGYDNYWQVLNASDFGVPQNRERVFIISIRKDLKKSFQFPTPPMIYSTLLEVLEAERDIPEKFYINDDLARPLIEKFLDAGMEGVVGVLKDHDKLRKTDISLCIDANYWKGFDNRGQRTGLLVVGKVEIEGELEYAKRVYDPAGQSPTLTAQPSKMPKIVTVGELNLSTFKSERRCYDPFGISPTLLSHHTHQPKIVVLGRAEFIKGHDLMKRIYSVTGISPTLNAHGGGNTEPKIQLYARIRRLIPLECWRLMGFCDLDFQIAQAQTSDTQLYRQAGNSIVVTVLEAILRNLFADRPTATDLFNQAQMNAIQMAGSNGD